MEYRGGGYKTILFSAKLSVKFKLLMNTEIAKINGNFRYKSQKAVIYPANKL